MSNQETKKDCLQVLNSLAIPETTTRITVLKFILAKEGKEFKLSEVTKIVLMSKPGVCISTVINAVALFKARGLVDEIKDNGNATPLRSMRGRPETKLIYTNKLRRL